MQGIARDGSVGSTFLSKPYQFSWPVLYRLWHVGDRVAAVNKEPKTTSGDRSTPSSRSYKRCIEALPLQPQDQAVPHRLPQRSMFRRVYSSLKEKTQEKASAGDEIKVQRSQPP